MALSEHAIQSAWFDWARRHPLARRAYAVPNAAKRSPQLAAYMIREGLRKGVLDVHLPLPVGESHGLFIEFKAGCNKLSPEQVDECQTLSNDGYTVLVCWDTVLAVDFTQRYLAGEIGPGQYQLKPLGAGRAKAASTALGA